METHKLLSIARLSVVGYLPQAEDDLKIKARLILVLQAEETYWEYYDVYNKKAKYADFRENYLIIFPIAYTIFKTFDEWVIDINNVDGGGRWQACKSRWWSYLPKWIYYNPFYIDLNYRHLFMNEIEKCMMDILETELSLLEKERLQIWIKACEPDCSQLSFF